MNAFPPWSRISATIFLIEIFLIFQECHILIGFFIILQQLVSLYKFNMWGKWQHSTCSSFWTWHRFYRAITVKTPCSTPHAYWAASMVAYSRACFCLFLFSLQWAPSIPASFSYLSSLPSTCLLHQLHHSQIFLFIQSPVLSSRIFKISTRVLEVLLCPVFSTIICLQEVANLDFADIASRDLSAEACRTLAWYVWFPLIPSQHSTWHCDWVSLYLLVGVSWNSLSNIYFLYLGAQCAFKILRVTPFASIY